MASSNDDDENLTRIPIPIECNASMAMWFTFKECYRRLRNSDCESPVTGDWLTTCHNYILGHFQFTMREKAIILYRRNQVNNQQSKQRTFYEAHAFIIEL